MKREPFLKKSTFITSYLVIVSVLITLFYTPLHALIWSTIANTLPWRELSNSMTVLPLNGKFKLMISTIVFLFFLLMSPAVALITVYDKLKKKTLPLLYVFFSFYSAAVTFIGVLGYRYYFIYYVVPSHEVSFTILQIPLKELSIVTFLLVVASTYIFFKKTKSITTTKKSHGIADDLSSIEKGQETSSKPTSLALSILSLQVLMWINIAVFIAMACFYLYGLTIDQELMMLSAAMSGKVLGAIFGLLFAVLLFFTSRGLMHQKQWARIATIILGGLMLFGFPIGTVIGIILIYGMTKGWQVEAVQIK